MIWQDRNETTLGTVTLIKSRMTDRTDNLDQVVFTCLEPVEKLHRLLYRTMTTDVVNTSCSLQNRSTT